MEEYQKRKEERILRPVKEEGKEGIEKSAWQPVSICHMLAIQCTYLTKWVWVVTAAVLGISFYAGTMVWTQDWWVACASVPFLGMTAITASFRSQAWHHPGKLAVEDAPRRGHPGACKKNSNINRPLRQIGA